MSTKVYCDLCGEFIAEYGYHKPKNSDLNQPSVLSMYYEGKSIYEEDIGWSGPKESIIFWACNACNRRFMDRIKEVAVSMGLKL